MDKNGGEAAFNLTRWKMPVRKFCGAQVLSGKAAGQRR